MSGRKVVASAGDSVGGTSAGASSCSADVVSKTSSDITRNGRKRGRTAGGTAPEARSNTPSGDLIRGDSLGNARVVAGNVPPDLADASQEGWSFFDALMRTDEPFRILVGALTTLYAVRMRKVQGIDARSYKAAKEKLVTFAATTTPWAVRGTAGDRRWSRGPLHQEQAVEGRPDSGAVERVGGLGDRVQSPFERTCPTCCRPAKAVFRKGRAIVCPSCVRRGSHPGTGEVPEESRGGTGVPETRVRPEAVEALLK